MDESGSDVSYIIPKPRNFAEVTKFSDDMKKFWLKATQKEIKNLISKQIILVQDPQKDEPGTQWMDVYKAKIQTGGTLDNLKLSIVVRGNMKTKN